MTTGCIKNLPVLFARAFENMLGSYEQVWDEPGKPVRDWDDKIVPILLIHGFKNLGDFGVDGCMV
jgi:predicted lipoprotein with Yx(FWY)xxD motif